MFFADREIGIILETITMGPAPVENNEGADKIVVEKCCENICS